MEPTPTPSTGFPRFPANLPKVLDYPVVTGVAVDVLLVMMMLVVARRFDPSGGSLTIALFVVTAFIGLVVCVSVFTIPADEETATVIGGLATAFGAVVAYWLRGRNGGGHSPPSDGA